MMQIFIRAPVDKVICLSVKPDDSIESIKQKLQEKEGLAKAQQRLTLKGTPLRDDCLLSDYDIQPNASLLLNIDVRVYLQLADGTIHVFVLKPDGRIHDLKQKINDKLGIPVAEQRIVHRGIQVDQDLPLSSYLFNQDTHNIVIKLRGH